ncbi:unnamed protein product [Rotaria magnacalcarata]|uniref:Transient receptor potential cation channel subfamily V member 6 n=5 Tax=Rotaria magnacalcarata TaxID=392030 RepID=A0A8S2NNS4_9BILA|nr:unnamed protein product [Rotaria magnacalcarata]
MPFMTTLAVDSDSYACTDISQDLRLTEQSVNYDYAFAGYQNASIGTLIIAAGIKLIRWTTGTQKLLKEWSILTRQRMTRGHNDDQSSLMSTILIAKKRVEEQTELMYKENTIWTAVFNADKAAIDELINHDPHVVDTRRAVGECPIHMLFLYGTEAHLDIARDLLVRFPLIATQIYNKPNYYGENILHLAIVKREANMVDWLLSHASLEPYKDELLRARATGDFFKIGQPSYYGETPLGFACCTNQWNMVEILLKHGADMDSMDNNDNTVLHMLVICNLPDMYAKFKARWIERQAAKDKKKTIKSEKSELPKLWNRLNKDGLTPLTLAANSGRVKMLSALLQERAVLQWSYGNVSCLLHPLDQLDVGYYENEKNKNIFTLIIKGKHWHITHRMLCMTGQTIVLAGAVLKGAREIGEMCSMGFRNYVNTAGTIFLENLASIFCLGIFVVQILRLTKLSEYESLVLAFTSLVGWGYIFFFTMPFRFTGPFVIMIYKMLFNDVLRFCIIHTIFLAGFSQAFFILFNENGFGGFLSSIKQCFLGLLGEFDLDYYIKGRHPLASVTLLICHIVVITILLLNLLIAMMGDTYADVKKSAAKLWHLERARIALEIENGMSSSERKSDVNKYWVDVKGERYLQVEQVADDRSNLKEGKAEDD